MPRPPLVIAGLLMAASLAWAIHFSSGPDPFVPGAGVVLAVGVLLYAVIDVAGLLLSRGRWARWLGVALSASTLVLGVVSESSPAALVGIGLSAATLAGLTGRWLDGWIRRRPAADGPEPHVVVLVLGLLGLVPAVALAAPDGPSTWHGVLAGFGLLVAWGYSRANLWALWAARVGLVVVAIPAIIRTELWGGVLLAAVTLALVILAWTPGALRAVRPLMDTLPGPRSIRSPS